jgi:hypothetical protein
MAIGQLVPLCLDGAFARFLLAVVVPEVADEVRFGFAVAFDPDRFAAEVFAADAFGVAADDGDFDAALVRRFGLLSPIGSASPTALTAPAAMSPTVPATLPA